MAFLDYQGFTVDENFNVQTISYHMVIENLPYIYNVDAAVGANCPNYREDVELVQALMRIVFGGITVDGLYGPETAKYISLLQTMAPFVVKDGRIDRALGALGSVSGKFYTITWLNGFAKRERPDLYGDPKVLATDMPSIIWRIRQKCGVFMAMNAISAAQGLLK